MKSMLAYATSVHERVDPLSLYYAEDVMDENISKWLSRKSLCTEELFDLSYDISRNQSKNNKVFRVSTSI